LKWTLSQSAVTLRYKWPLDNDYIDA